jgi:hypothetical protein
MSIDNTSSGRSSNSSATSQGSDVDNKVLHSALDENRLYQAEMELYNAQVARAHEIVQLRHREWGIESDSELSVLASSQFSIDDIGLGQGVSVELGDVEIGRTGEVQDSQDHSVDSGIQGIEISPRRTRSGKVVKYRDD